MPLEPEPDLHWTAFLYVGGDLDPGEATRFELRLLDDQQAREAVAAAVELAGALALVGPECGARRRPGRRRALAGASAMLAMAAGLVLAFGPWLRPARPDASEVALAWSTLRGAEAGWPDPRQGSQAAEVEHVEPEVEVEVEAATDRALPSWLLSAASATLDDDSLEED